MLATLVNVCVCLYPDGTLWRCHVLLLVKVQVGKSAQFASISALTMFFPAWCSKIPTIIPFLYKHPLAVVLVS